MKIDLVEDGGEDRPCRGWWASPLATRSQTVPTLMEGDYDGCRVPLMDGDYDGCRVRKHILWIRFPGRPPGTRGTMLHGGPPVSCAHDLVEAGGEDRLCRGWW